MIDFQFEGCKYKREQEGIGKGNNWKERCERGREEMRYGEVGKGGRGKEEGGKRAYQLF